MRALLTGGAGYLAQALVRTRPDDADVSVTWRVTEPTGDVDARQLDLVDHAATLALVESIAPDLIIHSAYSPAEDDIVGATRSIAAAAAATGAAMVHISTDMVFSGSDGPYDESSERNPINDYGRYKVAAEDIVTDLVPSAAIVRTSLLTGVDPLDPRSFAIVAAVNRSQRPRLFVDELRRPIAVDDAARSVWELSQLVDHAGPWHIVGPELLSRYAIGLLVARVAGFDPAMIDPVSITDHGEPRAPDLHLLTTRATAELANRPRSISELYASADAMSSER